MQETCNLASEIISRAAVQPLSRDELVVVAGAGGFIGGHIVAGLVERGFNKVRAVDVKPAGQWYQRHEGVEFMEADLREASACMDALEGAGAVIDLAADMGGMGFIEYHRADCMLSVLISTHLLIAARDLGISRFFYASSACVYNAEKQESPDVVALREEDAYPALPEDGYGWEKLFTERMCRHFREEFGVETRIARYHNVYGPLGTWDGGREKAPAAICRKVAQAKLGGQQEIEIWGDGEQTRSFMFIDDCVDGTMRISESDFVDPLNLGSDQLVTINQMVDIVEDIAEIKVKRIYNLNAPQGVRGRNSDNQRIQAALGWAPSIPLEDGLEKTYRWIYDQLASDSPDSSFAPLAVVHPSR
jgi:GDP-D-mannose 3',5'-epimerase